MKNTLKFALTAMLLSASPLAVADTVDCVKLSQSVKAAVAADSSKVLQIVASNVAANESCACEIVKAAIVGSGGPDIADRIMRFCRGRLHSYKVPDIVEFIDEIPKSGAGKILRGSLID